MTVAICCVVSILIPALMELCTSFRDKHNISKLLSGISFAIAIVNSLVLGGWLLMRTRWTCYEFFCLNAILSVLVTNLVLPLIRKQQVDHVQILKTSCLCVVIIACYSILTYGQTQIHSDTATATILAQSQLANGTWFPSSWNCANGDIWVITNNTFTFPFSLMMKNQPLARMLGSAVFVLVAAAALVYNSCAGFRDNSWVISVPLIVLFLSPILGDMTLYQAAYTGSIIWVTIPTLWAFKLIENPAKKRYVFLLSVLLLLLCIGGIRPLAEQVIPLILGYIAMVYAEIREEEKVAWKQQIREFLRLVVVILIPSIIGTVIYLHLSTKMNVNHTVNSATVFADTLQTCWNNLILALLHFFECFGFVGGLSLVSIHGIRNMVAILMCIIIIFVVPMLQVKKLAQEAHYIKFFFWYGVVHNIIMLIMTVLFGKTETRYLLTTVYVAVVISARYIYTYWISQVNFRKVLWTGLFVVATVFYCIPLLQLSNKWYDNLAISKQISQQLLERGITKGYATYWNAYNNEVYSDLNVRFGGVNFIGDEIVPFRWLVDNDVFNVEHKETVLLLSEDENRHVAANRPFLLEKAVELVAVNGLYIYFFDYDIATEFSNGLEDGIVKSYEFHQNAFVQTTADGLVVMDNGVVYGPCMYVDAGVYTVIFEGKNLSDGNVCTFDAFSGSNPMAVNSEVISAKNTEFVLRVTVSEPIQDVEFRMFGHSDENPGCLFQARVERKR